MKKNMDYIFFSDKSTDVYIALNKFLNFYFTQRNSEATLSLLSENVFSIGTGKDEIGIGKENFKKLLLDEIEKMPNPIFYEIVEFSQNERTDNSWDCFCKLQLKITTPDGIQVLYSMRLTVGMHLENGEYIIDILHASEASENQEEGEYFPFKFISREFNSINRQTKQELFEIISQVMPGGIIGGYMKEGFPFYVANERIISMMGYTSYEDFYDSIQGYVINTIHEDDREYVYSALQSILKLGDQYEIEYRMMKKDGSYFWVHDIGRLTVDNEGQDAIISIIIDISDQVNKNKMLRKEAVTDVLTGIYNRKGGIERIETLLNKCKSCMFFILDIDNFKGVNDIYGHKQGDEMLRFVAKQMTSVFRKSIDVVCRIGGDEFVIFVSDCDDIDVIEDKVNNLINTYYDMIQLKYPLSKSTISVGGIYTNKKYNISELYQLADKALYSVKNGKKGYLKMCIV